MTSNNEFLIALMVLAIACCNCKYVQKRETLPFENVEMHPSCRHREYCLEVDDTVYPHQLVEKLLKQMKVEIMEMGSTEHRESDHSNMTPCKSSDTIEPLYQIKDAENRVRWVVQSKDKFEQRIRMEWCLNKHMLTQNAWPLHLTQLLQEGQGVFCEELYSNYEFLVVSLDGTRIESVEAGPKSIPVCCICSIKYLNK